MCDTIDRFGAPGERVKGRLERQLEQLKEMQIMVKLNGATGNYNAHSVAFPKVDVNGWLRFTEDFVARFNNGRDLPLAHNPITTQIEPHDNYAEIFDAVKRVNTILVGFVQDMECECSPSPEIKNYFKEILKSFDKANILCLAFSSKLPISRLQRDLSDSTVERNFGVAFGHSLVGYSLILDTRLDEIRKGTGIREEGKREVIKEQGMAVQVGNQNMLSYKLDKILIPKIEALRDEIGKFAEEHASTPIAARTHGQFALPTTFGKEFHVFRARMNRQLKELKARSTWADSTDGAAEALDNLRRINTILIDFDQDVWRYISDDWIKQKVVEGEVGSSTLAQKVQPDTL